MNFTVYRKSTKPHIALLSVSRVNISWNSGTIPRTEEEKYSGEILEALTRRYEPPDSRNRWDSPHIGIP